MVTSNVCNKCNGTGYIPEYHRIQRGICFSCWGSGSHTLESNYPKLNSTLKEIVSNKVTDSNQVDLVAQIKELAQDFYKYESELIQSEVEQDDEALYYFDTKMNEIITKLFSLSKHIDPIDNDVKFRIKRGIRKY